MTTFYWTKYPFVRVGTAFILGIFFAYYFSELPDFKLDNKSISYLYVSITTLLLISIILLFFHKKIRNAFFYTFLFLCIGILRFLIEDPRIDKLHLAHINSTEVSKIIGEVTSEPVLKNNKVSYTLSIQATFMHNDWQTSNGFVKVYSKDNIKLGDVILLNGQLKQTKSPINEYDFNFAKYLAFHKTYHTFFAKKPATILNSTNSSPIIYLKKRATASRNHIEHVVKQRISSNSKQNIVIGLLTGKRNNISQEDKALFTNSGTIHILAISGMHIVLIYQLLIFILKASRLKTTSIISSLFILALIWFYVFVCGLQASTVRAGVMISILLLGSIIQKKPISINSLFATAFLMLLYNPYYIADVGFCLSFLAVTGICIASQLSSTERGLKSYLRNAALICTGAQILTLPYSILLFQQFPTYFLCANLLIIPLSTVLLIGSIAFLVVHQIPYLSNCITYIIELTCDIMFFILQTLNKLPYHLLTRLSLTQLETLLLYLIIAFIALALFNRQKKNLCWLTISCILFSFSIQYRIVSSYKIQNTLLISGYENNRQYLIIHRHTAYLVKQDGTIQNSQQTEKCLAEHFIQRITELPLPTQGNFSISSNQGANLFYVFRQHSEDLCLRSPQTGFHIIDFKNKYSYIKSPVLNNTDSIYTLGTGTTYIKQL